MRYIREVWIPELKRWIVGGYWSLSEYKCGVGRGNQGPPKAQGRVGGGSWSISESWAPECKRWVGNRGR